MPAALVVSGKVIDAVTRQPIKAFRVVPGVRSSETQMYWNESKSFIGLRRPLPDPPDSR